MRWVAIVACQRMHQTASWNPVFGSHPEWGWWNLKERSYYWQEYTLRMKITTVALLQLHNKWRKHKYPPTGASNQFIIGPGYIWGLNVFLSDQIMLRRLCNQCKWQNLVGKCATDLVAKFESYKRTRVLTAWFWSACGICQCFLTGKLKISLGPLRHILLYCNKVMYDMALMISMTQLYLGIMKSSWGAGLGFIRSHTSVRVAQRGVECAGEAWLGKWCLHGIREWWRHLAKVDLIQAVRAVPESKNLVPWIVGNVFQKGWYHYGKS